MKYKITKRKYSHNGMSFDSRDELERYMDLCCREIRGEVSSIHRQVRFVVVPRLSKTVEVRLKTRTKHVERVMERAHHYTCDFVYIDNLKDVAVIEDVKSRYTSRFRDYALRRANMLQRISLHNSRRGRRPFVFRECIVEKDRFITKDR